MTFLVDNQDILSYTICIVNKKQELKNAKRNSNIDPKM